MKEFGKAIVFTLGRALAFNVVLPAWAIFNMVTGKYESLYRSRG